MRWLRALVRALRQGFAREEPQPEPLPSPAPDPLRWPDNWMGTIEDDLREYEDEEHARKAAGTVRGRFYTEWLPHLDQLRKEKRDDEALELLLACIAATERESCLTGQAPPPAYCERAAIVYRRRKQYEKEVAIIERWFEALPGGDIGQANPVLIDRYEKARLLRDQHRNEP